jgi:YHS domain-containing protein
VKNKNFKILMTVSLISVFLITGLAIAKTPKAAKHPQTTCPVTGEKINKDFYTDFQCQRIYFCTAGCKDAFAKEPEKYMKKIADENVLLESIQKLCPVTGKEINKKFHKDYKGRRVYFCSAACIAEFKKNPDSFLAKLDEQMKKSETEPATEPAKEPTK